MAQLTSDAFAFGGDLLSVDAAIALFAERLRPVAETENVPLSRAANRILADDVTAPLPLPSFDNSAVDGYAVRLADLAPNGETTLRIADRVIAGDRALHPVAPGEAVRVFTGAPMPPGADTVYMQEDVRSDGTHVTVPPGLAMGANARVAGEDLARGAVALAAGRRLRSEDVALAAALGLAQVRVRRPLRVAVFSTGNEVVEPGAPLPPAALYDANRFLLTALLTRLGHAVTDLGILRDDRAAIAAALTRAGTDHDLIVTSGGVSTGEEDHVKAAVEAAGSLDFWRVAIKPGRPVALGVVGTAAFAGLPGNPVAVYVTFTQIVRYLLAALSGEVAARPRPLPVRAGFAYRKKAGRREYVRVRLGTGPDGLPVALKHAQDGAGVITSLTACDGLVELPEAVVAVAEGDPVGYLPFALYD